MNQAMMAGQNHWLCWGMNTKTARPVITLINHATKLNSNIFNTLRIISQLCFAPIVVGKAKQPPHTLST
jgi:hypothetical protein